MGSSFCMFDYDVFILKDVDKQQTKFQAEKGLATKSSMRIFIYNVATVVSSLVTLS